MKILQLISSIGFYGAENVVLEISKGLKKKSIDVIIGIIRDEKRNEIEDQAKHYNLPVQIFRCTKKFDFKTIQKIRRYVIKNKIDIIHSHNYKSNFYSLLSSVGLNAKLITTCHNWVGDSIKLKSYAIIDKILLNKFDSIIAVSEPVKSELEKKHINKKKLKLIMNGVDITKYDISKENIRNELLLSKNDIVIGAVGRLSEEKGHGYFIEAAKNVHKKYKNTKFIIVGNGPLMNGLKAMAKNMPVLFTGVRNDMPEIYNTFDIFVLPSIYEGLPMVLIEAMASRKTCVASDVGSISKVIEHMKNGILIKPRNSRELEKAICLLIRDRNKAIELAENGYNKIKEKFSSEIMVLNYIGIYNKSLFKEAQNISN